jgi:hypothetical protein
MEFFGFTEENLRAELIHITVHKAQGISFVGMRQDHMIMWLRTFIGKYHNYAGFGHGVLEACMEVMLM